MPVGFSINDSDLDNNYISKSYVLSRYPELATMFKTAGLWVWGFNMYGMLGTNDTASVTSIVQTVAGGSNWKYVSAARNLSAGVKTDGTLWTWGQNDFGQLGVNDRTHRSSPVQTVAGGTNWKIVSNSYGSTIALKTDNTLWTWGRNDQGQLGDGTTAPKSSPIQTSSGGSNWESIAGGRLCNAAIKTDGTLWTWGFNFYGQLGLGDTTKRQNPTQVGTDTTWKSITSGYGSAGIKTDGTLWMWGINTHGQLGTNDRTHRSSPVQTVAGGTNWKQASACDTWSTAAIKTDGTLWVWGRNQYGQLGTNNTTNYSSPVQTVAGGTNWYQVNSGYYTMSAIKTDGTLWSWGYNSLGELAQGTTSPVQMSSPVQSVYGGTSWKQVSARHRGIIAIRDDGGIF